MTKRKKPSTSTVVIYVLLFGGLVVAAYGITAPTTISFLGFGMTTTSVGLGMTGLAVLLLICLTIIGVKAGKKGRPEYPYYDPPRTEEKPSTTENALCERLRKPTLQSWLECRFITTMLDHTRH